MSDGDAIDVALVADHVEAPILDWHAAFVPTWATEGATAPPGKRRAMFQVFLM